MSEGADTFALQWHVEHSPTPLFGCMGAAYDTGQSSGWKRFHGTVVQHVHCMGLMVQCCTAYGIKQDLNGRISIALSSRRLDRSCDLLKQTDVHHTQHLR